MIYEYLICWEILFQSPVFWVFICCGFSEKHLLGKVLHKYNYYTIVSSISLMFDAKYEARAGSHLA